MSQSHGLNPTDIEHFIPQLCRTACWRKTTQTLKLNPRVFWTTNSPSENNIYREGGAGTKILRFRVKWSQKSSQISNNFPGLKNKSTIS